MRMRFVQKNQMYLNIWFFCIPLLNNFLNIVLY